MSNQPMTGGAEALNAALARRGLSMSGQPGGNPLSMKLGPGGQPTMPQGMSGNQPQPSQPAPKMPPSEELVIVKALAARLEALSGQANKSSQPMMRQSPMQ